MKINKMNTLKFLAMVLIAIFAFNIDVHAKTVKIAVCKYKAKYGTMVIYRENEQRGTKNILSNSYNFEWDFDNIKDKFIDMNYSFLDFDYNNDPSRLIDSTNCPTLYYEEKESTGMNGNFITYTFSRVQYPDRNITTSIQSTNSQNNGGNGNNGGSTTPSPTTPSSTKCSGDTLVARNNEFTDISDSLKSDLDELVKYTPVNQSKEFYDQYVSTTMLNMQSRLNKASGELTNLWEKYDCDVGDTTFNANMEALEKILHTYTSKLNTNITEKTSEAVQNGAMTEAEAQEVQNNVTNSIEVVEKRLNAIINDLSDYRDNNYGSEVIDTSCQGVLDPELVDFINDMLTWVRVLVPILLIVLGSVDFGKAVLLQEKDELPKAVKTFTKRCIIAIVIFFVPTILHILVNAYNDTLGQTGPRLTDLPGCGIE